MRTNIGRMAAESCKAFPESTCANIWLSVCIQRRREPPFQTSSLSSGGHGGTTSAEDESLTRLSGAPQGVSSRRNSGRPHLPNSSEQKSGNALFHVLADQSETSRSRHTAPHTSTNGLSHEVTWRPLWLRINPSLLRLRSVAIAWTVSHHREFLYDLTSRGTIVPSPMKK